MDERGLTLIKARAKNMDEYETLATDEHGLTRIKDRSREKRRTKNEERRTKNEERRTKNEERRNEDREQKNGLVKKVESAGRVARYIGDGLPHHGLNIGVDSD